MRAYLLYFALLLVACGCEEAKVTKETGGTQKAGATKKRKSDSLEQLGKKRVEDSLAAGTLKQKHVSYLDSVLRSYDLVDIRTMDSTIQVDLRYASANNFLGMDFYDGLQTAFFNCETAIKLSNAQYYLKQKFPGYSLIVLDAARPKHIQQLMWDSLHMPPNEKYNYLTPPWEHSMHNLGCAADVSIIDLSTNTLLDMGTNFDAFDKLSEPVHERAFVKSGELSKEAWQNRLLLRRCMLKAKFICINTEWWHFSSCGKPTGLAKYKLIK